MTKDTEIPPSVLFGPHGDAVCRVLEAGFALDEEGARRLASARRPTADRAYGTAWGRWLVDQPEGASYRGGEHAWVLAIPGAGPSPSPIGDGFSVLDDAVRGSARLRGGTGAFATDEDGEEVLTDPWHTARGALLDAAMAFGAPQLVAVQERATLTAAWNAVFGSVMDSDNGTYAADTG